MRLSEVLHERHGAVTLLTLNRPERRNALNASLLTLLRQEVAEFNADSGQKVLVITGAGDKAFCSGADLFEMKSTADSERGPQTPVEPQVGDLGTCEKPIIAAINGLAVGGGFEIALCSDIRIAADHAWFGLPEVKRGIVAGVAASLLSRLAGVGTALDIMLTGERLTAQEALRVGLVREVVPSTQLLDTALRKADLIAGMSPAALWATKKVIRQWRDLNLMEAHQYYRAIMDDVFASGDIQEGLAAFAEKREPEFRTRPWPARKR